MRNDFACFILSHGRPDNVITYETLKRCGYTGKIYIIVDDMDKTYNRYVENFGDIVIKFDKKAIAKTFDRGDNFDDYRSTSYVRNAMWKIAKDLGLKYFLQLDDDYKDFRFRFDDKYNYSTYKLNNLNKIIKLMIVFLKKTPSKTICFSQGGDFIGGATHVKSKRKAMNSFFCDISKPFKMLGRLNEDVNCYVFYGSIGDIFITTNQIDLAQLETQQNAGGMSDVYLDSGTYCKSFYTVMYHPSSVKVAKYLGRLHHSIDWKRTVPKILRESLKK